MSSILNGITEAKRSPEPDYNDPSWDKKVSSVGQKAKQAEVLKSKGKEPKTRWNPVTKKYYVDFSDTDNKGVAEAVETPQQQQVRAAITKGMAKWDQSALATYKSQPTKLHYFPASGWASGQLDGINSIDPDGTVVIELNDTTTASLVKKLAALGGMPGVKTRQLKMTFDPLKRNADGKIQATVAEEWSQKYKSSINCSHPKGFSQKAHCAGKKKHNESVEMESVCPDCGMCQTHGEHENLDEACWKGYHKEGNKKMFGKTYPNCVKNEGVAEGSEQQYLWHGSRQKIPMLEPRQSVDTGGAAGSNQNAIYATSDPKVAIAMGLTTPGSDTGMFPNDPQMVLFSGKIRKGENVYLHKVPMNGPDGKPQFVQGGNSREFHSVPGVKGIKPTEIKAVPVDKYLNLIRQATPADLELRKKYMKQGVAEEHHSESCPHCGGEMVSEELMNEKKDACYYKVKSRYKVWPSAYASGALVKCRKSGADSWGNGGKKNESVVEGPQDDPEYYRAHLLKTLPRMMNFLSKNVKGWKPTEEQYLAAIETGYQVMKHTGDVQQAGKAMSDELNTLHRMSQSKSSVAEGAPELLKQEMPLVRHIEQELAQHGYEKGTPEYDQMFKHTMSMYRKFGNVDAIKRGVAEGSLEEVSQDTARSYAQKARASQKDLINQTHRKGADTDALNKKIKNRQQGMDRAHTDKRYYKDEQGVAEGSEQINWIKPNFDFEWHEVEEQSKMEQVPIEVRQYYKKHFPNKQAWLKSVQNGKVVVVNPDHKVEIRNAPYDKQSLMQVLAPTGHEGPIGPAKEKRVNSLFDKGGPIEMPIILKTSKGLWLIGGKTRLGTANYIKGIPAKVWMIGGEQGVAEEQLDEKWSKKYKDSINCSNPKGFSQKAHCAGKQKNESSILEGIEQVDENLHQWFKEKWVRFGPDGKIRGACARGDDSEGKPKCLPQSKAQNLGKKGRASAAARKRREDPNPERHGKAINVNTKKK